MHPQNNQSSLFRIKKSNAPFYALVGIFVTIFSLNGIIKKIAGTASENRFDQFLFSVASLPDTLYKSAPGGKYFLFELLMRWLFFSIGVFLLLLLFNAIRQKSAAVLASGAGGLTLGIFLFTWVSLVIAVVYLIFRFIKWILGGIFYVLSVIFSAILDFILWSPVFYTLIGIAVLSAIALIIANFEDIWKKLLEFLRSASFLKKLLVGAMAVPVLAGIVYLLVKVWQIFLQPLFEIIKDWIIRYVVPVLEWIGWLLGWVLTVIGIILIALVCIAALLLSLLVMGYQYCDQFFQARNCGRSTHKAFDAGFSAGVGVAVVFLVCSAAPDYEQLVTAAWNNTMPFQTDNLITFFHALMPSQAESLLQGLFVFPALPIFDVGSLVVVFFLANCSLVMSLISGTIAEPLNNLFRPERLPMIFLLIFGAFFAIGLAVLSSLVPEES